MKIKMTEKEKNTIDRMPYRDMLKMYRFAPLGREYWFSEQGEYFQKVMKEKRRKLPKGMHRNISNKLGYPK